MNIKHKEKMKSAMHCLLNVKMNQTSLVKRNQPTFTKKSLSEKLGQRISYYILRNSDNTQILF